MNRMLSMFCALALAACGCSRQPGVTGPRVFGVTFQTMNNPFFVDLTEGMRPVVEGRGDRLEVQDAQFDSLKQRNDIADFVLKGVSAIFINPVNWEGVKGSLLQARQKGIPSIIIDAPVRDQELVLTTIASDNHLAGVLAAQALAKECRPARIVVLHLSVNKACIDRVEGFKSEVAKYPDMQILDVQEGRGTTEGGRPVMSDLIGRFPQLNAVFAINDPSALGAISALESAGKLQGVKVVSVDGSREALAAVKSGKLLSTSAQFPKEIGRVAAEVAYEHLAGKPIQKEYRIRVELITRENVDAYLGGANPESGVK